MDAKPVALILAVVLILSALVYRFTFGLRKRPDQTAKTQVFMLSTLGGGFLLLGLIAATDLMFSKRVHSEGIVTRLRKTTGKNASSSFLLWQPDGSRIWLDTDYVGSNLIEGERVSVIYLDRSSEITWLQVTSGAIAGWQDTETPGLMNILLGLTFGPGMLLGAWYIFRSKRRHWTSAQEQEA